MRTPPRQHKLAPPVPQPARCPTSPPLAAGSFSRALGLALSCTTGRSFSDAGGGLGQRARGQSEPDAAGGECLAAAPRGGDQPHPLPLRCAGRALLCPGPIHSLQRIRKSKRRAAHSPASRLLRDRRRRRAVGGGGGVGGCPALRPRPAPRQPAVVCRALPRRLPCADSHRLREDAPGHPSGERARPALPCAPSPRFPCHPCLARLSEKGVSNADDVALLTPASLRLPFLS